MVERVPGWTPHVARSLKEVLYRFLEEVHCTKAALYLRVPSNTFVLSARYGFGRGDAPADRLESDSPVVAALGELAGMPIVINRDEDAPLIADSLGVVGSFQALLTAVRIDGRVIGLVDARDKGGQQPFDDSDRDQAVAIAAELAEVVGELGLHRSLPPAVVASPPEPAASSMPSEPEQPAAALLDHRALSDCLEAAFEAVIRDRLYAVAVTVISGADAATVVVGGSDADESEAAAIRAHQTRTLAGVVGTAPGSDGWPVEWRRAPRDGGEAPRPTVIATDVALQDGDWSFILSVIAGEGSTGPGEVCERLRREVGAARRRSSLSHARRSLARRLLQPGDKRFPELLAHSMAVSRLCWSMAHASGIEDERAELAAIAGLLHDVGMRELDYDRLYRMDRPGPEHRRVFRRHVLSGERIVRGVGLEAVADAVRHHHERWDGSGYPDRVAGDRIPLLARMVHVAEVFDVLTSATSYLAPIPRHQALATMATAGGRQFDPEMVDLLAHVLT